MRRVCNFILMEKIVCVFFLTLLSFYFQVSKIVDRVSLGKTRKFESCVSLFQLFMKQNFNQRKFFDTLSKKWQVSKIQPGLTCS